ncbi:sensor histidine kinase [Rhodoferax saidenbachensis]|uniref:Two-component system sensor histidine kinase AlgZ n=1 Tax=Rhodoferax saidenbachensis TaxID=1484693 RepID=A0ABU1ZLH3_9BURK|nr:sensor histidine kinase [Rhodoferax saidenbachensis]MDR7306394.1 two-component system sensor histidine kinase AlgZ [Rhodoferax saidenbachensis]
MNDTQILSTFQDLPQEPVAAPKAPALVFDACQMGVVLRAVLFVEVAVGVASMYAASSLWDWVMRLALVTGAALPATLAWLLTACIVKRWLARMPAGVQYSVAVVLGAVAGAYGCSLLAVAGLLERSPWVASMFSGAFLSSLLVAALVMRAKGRTPADTAARLAELQSRIRPHFLFNTLNSAIALVRAEPAKAETLLEDLSDLFRHALMDQGTEVTLAEEIALAQRYMAIEKVRFGDRLDVQWSLDPEADQAKLPPLLLQPLVENAVRHGVEPSAAGAAIRISTQRRGSVVVVKVTNTVPAGQGAEGHGLALRNVQDRLSLLHDVQGQFRSGLRDGVYQVRMEFPA